MQLWAGVVSLLTIAFAVMLVAAVAVVAMGDAFPVDSALIGCLAIGVCSLPFVRASATVRYSAKLEKWVKGQLVDVGGG
jgi:hypothetical protein